jgi:hypothetical protein
MMRKFSLSIAAPKRLGSAALTVLALMLATVSPSRAQELPTPALQAAPPPPPSFNFPLPIAPTGGLDQRLMPSLSAPREGLITIAPGETHMLGIFPGAPGRPPDVCTIGREGLAAGLAQGSCAGVVNVPTRDDLLK